MKEGKCQETKNNHKIETVHIYLLEVLGNPIKLLTICLDAFKIHESKTRFLLW